MNKNLTRYSRPPFERFSRLWRTFPASIKTFPASIKSITSRQLNKYHGLFLKKTIILHVLTASFERHSRPLYKTKILHVITASFQNENPSRFSRPLLNIFKAFLTKILSTFDDDVDLTTNFVFSIKSPLNEFSFFHGLFYDHFNFDNWIYMFGATQRSFK